MGNKLRKDSTAKTKKLQTVYDTIKRERSWDFRSGNEIYTTAKEKYLVKLITEGHDISDETINHIINRCDGKHLLPDGKYGCCNGYILTEEEYIRSEDLKPKSLHRLNNDLFCYDGHIYYPVDMLSNPFGKCQTNATKVDPKVQEVYDFIKQKPEKWYQCELKKYAVKQLVDMIEKGESISTDVKTHIIYGCEEKEHDLDENFKCYSGILLRKETRSRKEFIRCQWSLLAAKCRIARLTTVDASAILDRYDFIRIFERICHRDLIRPTFAKDFRVSWQEQHLIRYMMLDKGVPNEVISHALEGCHIKGHLLTYNFACCRGYIFKRDIFFSHDVQKCRSHHIINDDLNCYEGQIYHRCTDIPYGSTKGYLKLQMNHQLTANPRLPPRPVPPPPDHLDNQLVQHPVVINRQRNLIAGNYRRNDNERNDRAVGAENMAPNRHQNAAPPPPEFDI